MPSRRTLANRPSLSKTVSKIYGMLIVNEMNISCASKGELVAKRLNEFLVI